MASFSYRETFSSSEEQQPTRSGVHITVGGGGQGYAPTSSHHSGSHLTVGSSGAGVAGSQGTVNQIAQDLLQLNQGLSSGSGSHQSQSGAERAFSSHGSHHGSSYGASAGGSFGASAGSSLGASAGFSQGASAGFSQSSQSASFSASSGGASTYLSEIETAILRSTIPIDISETEELTVNFKGVQERGIWANRSEVINWRGVIPITEYIINEDMNPEIITKRTEQQLVYIQELAIRYLRPPTPPAPGEILITQEMNTLTPPAPPLIIRQQPARPDTPEPLVIREAPPEPPAAVGRKVITISGKRIPPPPRKVIVERLAPLPSKPQSVLVERWLPYSQVKRRVIFQRSNERDAVVVKPRNVIVQWEAPQVVIKKEFKYLGVIRANPAEYVQRYGATLKIARELPQFVLDIKTPDGIVLAADYQYSSVFDLEGDVQALKLVDLDREGLSEYRSYLSKLGISFVGHENVIQHASQFQSSGGFASSSFAATGSASGAGGSYGAGFGGGSGSGAQSSLSHHSGAGGQTLSSHSHHSAAGGDAHSIVAEIFASIDKDHNASLSYDECARVLLKLNSRLGRQYGEDEAQAFLRALDRDQNGEISLQEFRAAFERLL